MTRTVAPAATSARVFRRAVPVGALAAAITSCAASGTPNLVGDTTAALSSSVASTTVRPSSPPIAGDQPMPARRCADNAQAGSMTFLTADRWTLSSPTAQVTLAEARGYFDELCLDVSIAPGDSSDNYALLAGGEASFIGGASLVELADFAGRNDRGFVAALVAAHSTEQTTDGVLVTTQRFVDLHPSAADDFVRATLRAATDLTEGPAEANAQITRWAALRNDSPALSRVTPLSTISPIVEPTALQRELDGALDAGVLEGPIATIDQLVDSAFAQRVLDDDGHLVWPGG